VDEVTFNVPVPFLLSVKVTPVGSPVAPSAGTGNPVVFTVNVPPVPWTKPALEALVIAGGWFTVKVKLWVAFVPTPLLAVNRIE
jgi:hypothetical protein